MIKRILAGLAALASVASAFMFILLKKFKADNELEKTKQQLKNAERREEQTETIRKAEKAVAESIAKQEAEDEKLVERMHGNNNLDSFNAGIDLLRKQSEKGNKRNSSAGSSGA